MLRSRFGRWPNGLPGRPRSAAPEPAISFRITRSDQALGLRTHPWLVPHQRNSWVMMNILWLPDPPSWDSTMYSIHSLSQFSSVSSACDFVVDFGVTMYDVWCFSFCNTCRYYYDISRGWGRWESLWDKGGGWMWGNLEMENMGKRIESKIKGVPTGRGWWQPQSLFGDYYQFLRLRWRKYYVSEIRKKYV